MYYLYHPHYCPAYIHNAHWPVRQQLPPVDPELFYQSANEMKNLMKDVSLVLDKLAESKEFDAEVMYAAQASDREEVERLIQTIGITSEVNVDFNPDNLRLEFRSKVEDTECCRIQIAVRWR